MSITDQSRYNNTVVIKVINDLNEPTENEHIDLPYDRSLVVSTEKLIDLHEYKAKDGDSWSNVAARFFRGRSDLWWVIAEFSGVIDPFLELNTGAVLKIPQFSTVVFQILNFDSSKKGRPSDKSIT